MPLKDRKARTVWEMARYHKDKSAHKKRMARYWDNGGRERHAAYMRARKTADAIFKLRSRISTAMHNTLRRIGSAKDGQSWEALVGYSAGELMRHLESRFEPWMAWRNHGILWEIDHITPISSFKTPESLIQQGWALENLRPLCKELNRRKRDQPSENRVTP